MPSPCQQIADDFSAFWETKKEVAREHERVKETGDLSRAKELHRLLIEKHIEMKVEVFLFGEYSKRISELQSMGYVETLSSGELGIVGIDGNEHKVPSFSEIIDRVTPERAKLLNEKYNQGFTRLLIVPLGAPLRQLAEKYSSLLKDEDVVDSVDNGLHIDRMVPLELTDLEPDAEKMEYVVYYPEQQPGQPMKVKTKQGLIDSGSAFEVLLVENHLELPKAGAGSVISGRRQFESEETLEALYSKMRNDPQYAHEQSMTIEAWMVLASTHLLESNIQIDVVPRHPRPHFLGSYYTSGNPVFAMNWQTTSHREGSNVEHFNQLYFSAKSFRDRDTMMGTRTVVNVMG